ncbi:MAG: gliding-motility protein MglA, partial [Verrucomicrobiota bacterium]
MAVLHPDSREIQFKVVFCGPPRGGKTTNLSYIYRKLDPHFRGDLVSIATEQDRTICFDYLPVNSVEIAGYQTRFQLYTVPGQQVYRGTRDTVLNGADGVVFFAVSSPHRLEATVEADKTSGDSLNNFGVDAS